jgi:hypothetical protein
MNNPPGSAHAELLRGFQGKIQFPKSENVQGDTVELHEADRNQISAEPEDTQPLGRPTIGTGSTEADGNRPTFSDNHPPAPDFGNLLNYKVNSFISGLSEGGQKLDISDLSGYTPA